MQQNQMQQCDMLVEEVKHEKSTNALLQQLWHEHALMTYPGGTNQREGLEQPREGNVTVKWQHPSW
jgi:hypothetical protein